MSSFMADPGWLTNLTPADPHDRRRVWYTSLFTSEQWPIAVADLLAINFVNAEHFYGEHSGADGLIRHFAGGFCDLLPWVEDG